MSTEEKFEAFKQDLIDKNEKKYGAEVRKRWGDTIADASNEKMKGLTKSEWQHRDEIEKELKERTRKNSNLEIDKIKIAGENEDLEKRIFLSKNEKKRNFSQMEKLKEKFHIKMES